jgi:anti-anti-sigma factor
MDADLCGIARYSEEHEALFLTGGTGWRPGAVGSVRMEADDSQYGFALSSSVPVVIGGEESSEHRLPPPLQEYGIASGVALRIGESRSWGVMGIHTRERRWFNEEDLNFLQAVVNILSTAVERERREALIRDLSTPVLPIREGLLMVPLIGEMDAQRVNLLTENLLRAVRDQRARMGVLDVTGLGSMNALLAQQLLQTADAAKLMGAEVIVTGVSPVLAETIVTFGIDFSRLRTMHDLRGGIEMAEYLLDSKPTR